MAGIQICEPSTLYNILTQVSFSRRYDMFYKRYSSVYAVLFCYKVHGFTKPALLSDTHLLLLGKWHTMRI